jgi:hypothetical protein
MTPSSLEIDVEILPPGEAQAAWDKELTGLKYSTYSQTTAAARFEENVNPSIRAHLLRARGKNGPLGWLMALEGFIYQPFLARRRLLKFLTAPLRGMFGSLSWNYGPVLAGGESAAGVLRKLLEKVDEIAHVTGIALVREALPPALGFGLSPQETVGVFEQCGYLAIPAATVLLDLESKSLGQLWDGLTKDARRTVRKAREQGVTVIEATEEEHFEAYYEIRRQTASRNGLQIPSLNYFREIRHSFPREIYKIFLGQQAGRWVSGQGAGVFNGNFILGGVCYSDYARENSLYGTDLLQWHVIESAKNSSANYVDWAGYFINSGTSHQKGINHFKLKWGGEVVTYHKYRKIYSPVKCRLLELARKLRTRVE